MNEFFIRVVKSLCDKHNVNVDVGLYTSTIDVFEALQHVGLSDSVITEAFVREMNSPFEDITQVDFAFDCLEPSNVADVVKHVKIFPFRKDNFLYVAISSPEQKEFAENLIKENNYQFCFCFDFLIDYALSELNISEFEQGGIDHAEKSLLAINSDRKTVIMASGNSLIDRYVKENDEISRRYHVISTIEYKNQLFEYCEETTPDILIVGDNLGGKGTIVNTLLQIKTSFPDIRIIYLAGPVDADDDIRRQSLGFLGAVGIYDIITIREISVDKMRNILDEPMEKKHIQEFLSAVKDGRNKPKGDITIVVPTDVESEEAPNLLKSVYTFTSSKGGVGKSFIIKQLAVAISSLGIQRKDGKRPKVAIIDLDLQGFGISHFFNTLHPKQNIIAASEKIATMFDETGAIKSTLSKVDIELIQDEVKQMFRQAPSYPHIKILGGTDKLYQKGDINKLNINSLTYIVQLIADDYDVVLIDANTDMDSKFVNILYRISTTTYFVLDMDWGTFHNNKRHIMFLKEEGVYTPENIQYVLNKAIEDDDMYVGLKDVADGLEISFSNIFPIIDPVSLFNLSCKGQNLIQHGGENLSQEKYYFLKMANELYPIHKFDIIEAEYEGKTKLNVVKKTKNKEKAPKVSSEEHAKKREERNKKYLDDLQEITDGFSEKIARMFKKQNKEDLNDR